ncbi:MAG: GTP cyclohydrolase I [Geminicoccaceae bacterium]
MPDEAPAGARTQGLALAAYGTRALPRPNRAEVENAVRTLIAWAGDDPERAGLRSTPGRVAHAFGDLFAGYRADPVSLLRSSLMPTETGGQLVLLRAIGFVSFCEHHLLPFTGHADIGYVPRRHIVGLGSIAAAVDAVARRLQIQERMTDELASAIAAALDPMGVAVVVRAEHQCLAARGACKAGTRLVTSRQLGSLAPDQGLGRAFFELLGTPPAPGSNAENVSPCR